MIGSSVVRRRHDELFFLLSFRARQQDDCWLHFHFLLNGGNWQIFYSSNILPFNLYPNMPFRNDADATDSAELSSTVFPSLIFIQFKYIYIYKMQNIHFSFDLFFFFGIIIWRCHCVQTAGPMNQEHLVMRTLNARCADSNEHDKINTKKKRKTSDILMRVDCKDDLGALWVCRC